MKLLFIAQDHAKFLQAYEQAQQDGDTEAAEQALQDLQQIEGAFEDKVASCAFVVRQMEAEAEACKAWAKQATEQAKAREAQSERLRQYIDACMTAAGCEKVDRPGIKVSYRASVAVLVDEGAEVPEEYLKPPKERDIDKKKIGDDLKEGVILEFARMEKRKNLQIK